jgi:hypothetical protein
VSGVVSGVVSVLAVVESGTVSGTEVVLAVVVVDDAVLATTAARTPESVHPHSTTTAHTSSGRLTAG